MVLYICVKFHENTSKLMVFKFQSEHKYMTEIIIYNVQRAVTPNVGKQEIWFLCSASCLTVLYSSGKFHENI